MIRVFCSLSLRFSGNTGVLTLSDCRCLVWNRNGFLLAPGVVVCHFRGCPAQRLSCGNRLTRVKHMGIDDHFPND
jgi:hypothetical protein